MDTTDTPLMPSAGGWYEHVCRLVRVSVLASYNSRQEFLGSISGVDTIYLLQPPHPTSIDFATVVYMIRTSTYRFLLEIQLVDEFVAYITRRRSGCFVPLSAAQDAVGECPAVMCYVRAPCTAVAHHLW